jgi:hypothetical protein
MFNILYFLVFTLEQHNSEQNLLWMVIYMG